MHHSSLYTSKYTPAGTNIHNTFTLLKTGISYSFHKKID
jgi:hypothetical protein